MIKMLEVDTLDEVDKVLGFFLAEMLVLMYLSILFRSPFLHCVLFSTKVL